MAKKRSETSAIARRGLMLVLSSPSGAGKTTLSRRLLEQDGGVTLSISVTTRKMRPGEEDGRDYHFIDQQRFDGLPQLLVPATPVFEKGLALLRLEGQSSLEQ